MVLFDQLIIAFSWTLFHSLWQGILVLAISATWLQAIRKNTATMRYQVLKAFFILYILGVVITFLYEWQSMASYQPYQGVSAFIKQVSIGRQSDSWYSECYKLTVGWINSNASIIVFLWGVVFFTHLLKLCINYRKVQKIRHENVFQVSEQWVQRMEYLKEILQIKKNVLLRESALISTPLVLGVLKPLILVPVGMLNALKVEEVEAIFLHELAHIKREDFFVNICQVFFEAIFFFNPGFLKLSKMMKQEREFCCDEMAVEVINEKKKYIEALVVFQEYQYENYKLAQTFKNKEGNLLERAKKILTGTSKPLSSVEKGITCFGFLLLFYLVYISISFHAYAGVVTHKKHSDYLTKEAKIEHSKNDVSSSLHSVPEPTALKKVKHAENSIGPRLQITDTTRVEDFLQIETKNIETPSNQSKYLSGVKKNGTNIQVKMKSGKISEVIVNGKFIAEADYDNYIDDITVLQKKAAEQIPITSDYNSGYVQKQENTLPETKQVLTPKQIRLNILNAEVLQLEADQKLAQLAPHSEEIKAKIQHFSNRLQIIESEKRILMKNEIRD